MNDGCRVRQMVCVRVWIKRVSLLPINLRVVRFGLATTKWNMKKPSHTLEVQAGEYPFGVVNGFPLEL